MGTSDLEARLIHSMEQALDIAKGGAPRSAALKQREANLYLGRGPKSHWLLEAGCPIPKVDQRKAGASKPSWYWLKEDLDAFLESRRVKPGETNPMDLQ
jgi:hypothetical protein